MVERRNAGVTRNWAPASMQARAVSGSRTVPAPSIILSPRRSATCWSARMAPGTVMVISAARTPPPSPTNGSHGLDGAIGAGHAHDGDDADAGYERKNLLRRHH